MPKPTKPAQQQASVRTRRAYFDCRFGQLHVRTAFPTTGGFDEHVTLFCLHPRSGSSRVFDRFLPRIAADRSVYAPDLPGQGESDAPPASGAAAAAAAASDLADGLRLRQIDVLGFQDGSEAAVEFALARPQLVRRLVLVGLPSMSGLARLVQSCLVLQISDAWADATRRAVPALPHARLIEAAEYADDLFDVATGLLVEQLAGFLDRDAPQSAGDGRSAAPRGR